MTFADAKQRFSNRVADYVRYRPSYPPALVDLLRSECGLRAESVIVDTGSGTGLLSELFLKNGNRVFGVEPNAEMRAGGEQYLRSYTNFKSVDGAAEATTLPAASANFITAGQAFHWFEPAAARQEFRRILKPGGWVVVVWNDHRVEGIPLNREYEELLVRFGINYLRVRDSYPKSKQIRDFFESEAFETRDLANHQSLDWDGFQGRLRSSSYAPTEDHANFAPMMAEMDRLFRAHQQNGLVRMEYFTRIYFGQLRADRN
jgi:SAM-dependent methyltransferase